jgi:hypothetical protein
MRKTAGPVADQPRRPRSTHPPEGPLPLRATGLIGATRLYLIRKTNLGKDSLLQEGSEKRLVPGTDS